MESRQEAPASPNSLAEIVAGPVVARAELRLVPPFKGSPGGRLALQQQDTTTAKPAGMQETPPDAPREPLYFVVRAGDREIQGAAYRSTRPGGPVALYLDTDGDGLWSDEKGYVGKRLWSRLSHATYEFGPVYLRQGCTEPGGDAFYAQCSDGKWLTFWPAFYRDGKVVLDGRTYRVALVDRDLDGRFDTWFVPPAVEGGIPGGDMLAVDLNGDSEFTDRLPDELEIMPLSRVIRIGGRQYAIEVARDGGTIEFRQVEP